MFANMEYEVDEFRRDLEVLAISKEKGIRPHYFHDRCIIEPGVIKTKEGKTHTVRMLLSRHASVFILGPVGLLSLPKNLDRKAQRETWYIPRTVSSPGGQSEFCPPGPTFRHAIQYTSTPLHRGL